MTAAGMQSKTTDDLERAVDLFSASSGPIELRVLQTRHGTVSGYFTDREKLVAAARSLDGKGGVYVTLNPAVPEALARAENAVMRYAKNTTGDGEIAARRWALLDFDPVRLSGIPSTDAEHDRALMRARVVYGWLIEQGIPKSSLVVTDSGNGAAILVRLDLPNDAASTDLVQRLLGAVARRFSTPDVKVDRAVFNAGRITRLPGTLNMKGSGTAERPHRRARLLHAPDELVVCPTAAVEAIVALEPAPSRRDQSNGTSGSGGPLDLPRWLAEHGLTVAREKPWQDGMLYLLDACPFDTSHGASGEVHAGQWASGAVDFKCMHDSCAGRKWRDVRDLLEPESRERRESYSEANTPNCQNSPNGFAAPAWEAPIRFESQSYGPPVPLEALPPAIGNFVGEVAAVHQVSADLAAAAALGAIAVAARYAVVQVGTTHGEPLNLYLAPTAEPGERKASVIRECAGPLEDAERQLAIEMRPTIAQAIQRRAVAEKRLKFLQDAAAKKDDPAERDHLTTEAAEIEAALPAVPAYPQILFDDVTPEAVAKALADQGGCIAIMSEEAGGLFEMLAGRYANGVASLDNHLKAYDGGRIAVTRIGRPAVMIDHPRLTIVVTPQPSVLDRLGAHPDFRGRGLLGRFAFVLPTSLVGQRKYQREASIQAATRFAYSAAIHRIFDGRAEELLLQGPALNEWADFADELEAVQGDGGRLAHIRDWASKHAGRVARIAGLLHLVKRTDQGDRHIAVDTVIEAWAIGEWLVEHALAAYGRMTSDPCTRQAKWILAWIRRHRLATFTLRNLADNKRDVEKPEDFLPALALLEARHFIRRNPEERPVGKRGRRPSPSFAVNPGCYSEYSDNSGNCHAAALNRELAEFSEFHEPGAVA